MRGINIAIFTAGKFLPGKISPLSLRQIALPQPLFETTIFRPGTNRPSSYFNPPTKKPAGKRRVLFQRKKSGLIAGE